MDMKTALITGVSRPLGLGFAVGRQLAELGYHVILTARDIGQAELLAAELRHAGFSASALRLDLADRASIEELSARLTKTVACLDVLVNNASAMPDFQTRSAFEVDLEALQTLFAVNVIGCWGLIQALLPLLQRAPAARIVNVTSAAAQQIGKHAPGPLFAPAYSLAKYTLNALTATLANSLVDTPILINAVDPGSVASHPERGDDENDRPPAEAAKDIVWAATLDANGASGCAFSDRKPVSVNPL
ncbi:SDR family NAD(P)-dependent oxidoreductase [Mangrovicella endophytica]|uniref:SDR family NAD(P)-dependent oxidoreductase n=1 Tax=Mangrovicella endophytica TaxID=2066697 RepID=UPI000C9E1978|nr:SDR family NAD(P)-dependent oxidoreductase [Mangrovicella endophytica]